MKNYNNDYFGWNNSIARKNYTINILIVFALYIVLSLVNFSAFEPFIPIKFLLTLLVYIVEILKIVLVMAILSLIYRRIADFSLTKPYQFQLNMKRVFIFLYVIPVLYLFCIRYFFNIMPALVNIFDMIILFLLLPLAFIFAIVLCFIKGT